MQSTLYLFILIIKECFNNGFIQNQFANVIEWNESRDDVIFWLWRQKEIKRGSRLLIRPGQDAFFYIMEKLKGSLKMKEIMKSSRKLFLS